MCDELPPEVARQIPTYEQLYKVYQHARGLCFGVDWNKGHHREALIAAVNDICKLPDGTGRK